MAKAIMIQGTTSNAGKSWIAAGLCRIFMQDGYRVAPFKSQNMALNSFITQDGLEMGRAQVVQAEAAGKIPDVRMNPILLKPTSDEGSQVIVNGRVLGNKRAVDYFKMKTALKPDIMKAYNSLAAENDIIVIEGAGSPAEINLLQHDIVNMGMARMANAPVLIVGDIDRGGVFASLYGTVKLLEQDRAYMKGTIINKFRGDAEILKPGLNMLEELIDLPAVGVVPYLKLDIDDEDSLSERLISKNGNGAVDIAVIRLPKISNFTDFGALSCVEAFSVRYVSRTEEFGTPDLVILPGTKNTIADLKWLKESGLAAKIQRYAGAGNPLIGICGGYQMLCRTISDPYGVEEGGETEGLGLVEAETIFGQQKMRTRVNGRFGEVSGVLSELSGAHFEGYEIHMGKTIGQTDLTQLSDADGNEKQDGVSDHISVYGSYVHGLFDSNEVLQALSKALLKRKDIGTEQKDMISLKDYKEQQYNLLADSLRRSLDMELVYKILNEGVKEA